MSILKEKLLKARQLNVEIDGFTFTILRPTESDVIYKLFEQKGDELVLKVDGEYLLEHYVINWANVKEADIIPGGAPDAVPFDKEVFVEWALDNINLFTKLPKAIIDSYFDYMKRKDDALGEQDAG